MVLQGDPGKIKDHEAKCMLFLVGRPFLSIRRTKLTHGREAAEFWEGDILG